MALYLRTAFCICLVILCLSCEQKNHFREAPSSKKKIDIHLSRLDKDLQLMISVTDSSKLESIRRKYPVIFEIYNTSILNIGSSHSPMYIYRLLDFLHDKNISAVFACSDSVFNKSQMASLEHHLSASFSLYHAYFPDKPIPSITTFVSGFNYGIVSSDSSLGIGLDMFLGKNNRFYRYLEYPKYKTNQMNPENIPVYAMMAWLEHEFFEDFEPANFIDEMMHQGRLYYLAEHMLPEVSDSVLFSFTGSQMAWCTEHQKEVWLTWIEKKMLFNSNRPEFMRNFAEGPFTPGFPREAPPNLGSYMGYQIVCTYMKKHDQTSLSVLMQMNPDKLFKAAGYKPS